MFKTWLKKNEIKINKIDMTPTPARKNEKKIFGRKNYGLEFEKGKKNGGGEYGRTKDWDCTK